MEVDTAKILKKRRPIELREKSNSYVLSKLDKAFLLLLPSFIILVDLSSWTGRLVFNEFDFLIAPLAIYLGIKGLLRKKIAKRYLLFPILLLSIIVSNVDFAGLYQHVAEPLYTNVYYSSAYAFKIAKGFFYGFLLAVYLASIDQSELESLTSTLIKGALIGSIFLFLVILWERGVLYRMLSFSSIWDIAGSFLNFSTTYRVTALSSDMHTGGEAYDGLLLYLMPLSFMGTQYFNDKRLNLLSLVAVFCLSYCVMVGFTRATYFAVGLVILYLVLSHFRHHSVRVNKNSIILFIGLTLVSVQLFVSKGYSGLIAIYFVMLVFSLVPNILRRIKVSYELEISAIISLLGSLVYISTAESKWISEESVPYISALCCVLLVVICFMQAKLTERLSSPLDNLYRVIGQLGIISIACILFTGYQFNARMETAASDLKSRFDHWLKIAESSTATTTSFLFGNGIGSLPINYLTTHPEVVAEVGTFTIRDNSLILSRGHDLTFGQRVDVKPHTTYQIKLDIEGYKPTRIPVSICERNIIYSSNFAPVCAGGVTNYDSASDSYTLEVDSGTLGKGGFSFLKWPVTFVIKNRYGKEPIKIKSIELVEQSSSRGNENLLKNARFEQGMDHWYFYNDFEHLPFHIKNIYLGFFYQFGIVGLSMVLLMIATVVITSPSSAAQKNIKHLILAYFIGLFSFGLFGDPLDSARANILFSVFFFYGFFLLSKEVLNKKKLKILFASVVGFTLVLAAVSYQSPLSLYVDQFKKVSTENSVFKGESTKIYKKPTDLKGVGSDIAFSKIPVADREIIVTNEQEFKQAIKTVSPGEHIVLMKGVYRFSGRSPSIRRSGEPSNPIVIRAAKLGDVTFEMDLVEGLLIRASHLYLSNIIFRGVEGADTKIEHAIHIVGNADFITVINNQFINFNSHIKSNGHPKRDGSIDFPDYLKIVNNDFYNEWPRQTKSPTAPLDIVGGDSTLIKSNFIADFAKASKEGYWVSTGAFLKGGGSHGVFDNNVVMCEMNLPHSSPREVRIGLSFGNGGTGRQFCADKKCEYEHSNGIMTNNTILNCVNDVGIYLNKSRNTLIENNAIRSSYGIDVRFKESDAIVRGNVIEGRVKAREGATIHLEDNIIE
ncbi:chondroitinase-B domain-containing protein [Thalassotalea montiporae]